MHQDRCLCGMTTRLRRDCIWLMGKFYGLIRIPFVQPFFEPLPTTNNKRQKSSKFATYILFKDHFDTRGILLDQHHVLLCSQFLLAHALKNNVHKRAFHRRNLLIKKFIQPKSINQHQPTKINHQNQSTNIYPCFFTYSNHHLLLEPNHFLPGMAPRWRPAKRRLTSKSAMPHRIIRVPSLKLTANAPENGCLEE